jgi:hypothetical protein
MRWREFITPLGGASFATLAAIRRLIFAERGRRKRKVQTPCNQDILTLYCNAAIWGRWGMFWWHPLEARTIQKPPVPANASILFPTPRIPSGVSNLFHQILPPTALILGFGATTVWMCFLGYQIARLVEAAL